MKLFGNAHAKRPAPQEPQKTAAPQELDQALDGLDDPEELDELDELDDPEDWDEEPGEDGEYLDTELEDEDEEKRRLPTAVIVLISTVATLLVLAIAGALVVNYFLDLINYQNAGSEFFVTVAAPEELPEETPETEQLAAMEEEETRDILEATPEELAQWDAHIEEVVTSTDAYEIPISEDVYNILLIGSDTRVSGEVGRSDAMILVSINQKTQTIYLTSFLRDCYVHVPGYGNTRLNHAFAYGGPALLEETLEENFKVHVDRYVMVDFFSFMDVVDTLGGIWINISEDEREITNSYIWSMNKLLGVEWSTDYIWSSGWHKLNGKQALCYARDRYTGNDFDRTQRQRNIISQVILGAKSASASQLVELAQVILPQVTTDLSKTQVLSYAANIGAFMNYEVISQQIPAAGTYQYATISGMSVISLDLDDNIRYLQGTAYAGTEYGFPIQDSQSSEDYNNG